MREVLLRSKNYNSRISSGLLGTSTLSYLFLFLYSVVWSSPVPELTTVYHPFSPRLPVLTTLFTVIACEAIVHPLKAATSVLSEVLVVCGEAAPACAAATVRPCALLHLLVTTTESVGIISADGTLVVLPKILLMASEVYSGLLSRGTSSPFASNLQVNKDSNIARLSPTNIRVEPMAFKSHTQLQGKLLGCHHTFLQAHVGWNSNNIWC